MPSQCPPPSAAGTLHAIWSTTHALCHSAKIQRDIYAPLISCTVVSIPNSATLKMLCSILHPLLSQRDNDPIPSFVPEG